MRYLNLFLVLILALIAIPTVDAATEVVYPNGATEVTVPAAQHINVFHEGSGRVRVYKQVGGPSGNTSKKWTLETGGDVENEEVTFGPYTNATVIRIEAGSDRALYSVGANAEVIPCLAVQAGRGSIQFAPVSKTATATFTAPELMNGLITGTHTVGATVQFTLPTGTDMDTYTGFQIGQSFEWTFINLSAAAADTLTLVANTGHTIVGGVIIQSQHSSTGLLYGASARFLTKKTAANTFVTYRIGN